MDWMIWDSNSGSDKRFFSSQKRSDQLWGSPSLVFSGYCDSFPRIGGLGVVDQSHIANAEIKSQWNCIFTRPLLPSWHGQCLGFIDTLKAYCIKQDSVMFYRENLDLIKI